MSKLHVDLATVVRGLLRKEATRDSDTPETVHVFRRDYMYSCFGYQAITIADEFLKTTRVVRHEQGIECVDISRKLMAKIGGALLDRHVQLCIWHKQDPSSASSPWEIKFSANDANFDKLEDELGALDRDITSSCFSLAVSVGDNDLSSLGVAVVSNVTKQIYLFEFKDDRDFLK
jgi:hypothetical protein